MKNVGIICEYNPFHGGHAHQIREVRRAGGEVVVALMSGNFTQRGEAAILPPTARAELAVRGGADLVLELPFPFAAASARYFATGGVRALAALGVDTLSFGSEVAERCEILELARRSLSLEEERAPAFEGAAKAYFEALGRAPLSNEILAIEYTRAILAAGLDLAVFPVKREGAGYHEAAIGWGNPSATALRSVLRQGGEIAHLLPEATRESFSRAVARFGVADTARLGGAMLALLRREGVRCAPLEDIAEAGGGLAAHLCRAALSAKNYDSLCREAATKKYTDGRIRRTLLYAMGGVRGEDLTAPPAYLRLLGMNEKGREFLAKTKKTRTVPVVSTQAEIAALGAAAERQRALAKVSDGLYALCLDGELSVAALQTAPVYCGEDTSPWEIPEKH